MVRTTISDSRAVCPLDKANHREGRDVDVLRQIVQFMAQRLMELDVEGRCGSVL